MVQLLRNPAFLIVGGGGGGGGAIKQVLGLRFLSPPQETSCNVIKMVNGRSYQQPRLLLAQRRAHGIRSAVVLQHRDSGLGFGV